MNNDLSLWDGAHLLPVSLEQACQGLQKLEGQRPGPSPKFLALAQALNHPQSNLADFYRELGDIYGVPLRPSNRWGGFKALRERWLSHLESSRCRAVLLVDKAQEMTHRVRHR